MTISREHWRQRLALTLIGVTAAILFLAASTLTSRWSQKRKQLATQWTSKADAYYQVGLPKEAVTYYRDALAYNDDPNVRFRMPKALSASGQSDEANTYLRLLLVQEPGNADYNLALARLEAGERKFTEAERLYDTAIHGTWQSEPELNRAKTYLELVHLFQQEGKLAKARATLQLFEAEAPRDRELRTEMVTLFRDLDDPASASAALRTLLTETPSDWHLHKLQADLLLRTGDFESALREAKIVNEHEHDDASHFNLETAQAANDLTPYARGLHAKNEAARLQSILQRLQQRLTACAPESPELAQTQHWMATVTHEAVHDNPDILDQVAGFAGNTEQRYASCPDRNAKDLAIIWIGKQA